MEKIGRETWSQQKCNFTLDFFFSDWIRKISKTKYYCHNILCTFSCTYYLNSYVSLIRINKPFIQHFVYSVVTLKYAFFNSGKFSWNKFVYSFIYVHIYLIQICMCIYLANVFIVKLFKSLAREMPLLLTLSISCVHQRRERRIFSHYS